MSIPRSIPEELIEIKARAIWRKRQRQRRSGTPESDWEEARKHLEKHQWKVFWWEVRNPNNREFALEILKTLGIGLTAFGLLFSVWEGLEDRRLTQERLVTERFSKAVEQLGKYKDREGKTPDTTVRIGGIYALERIAKDSPKDYWTIMEVLTSYVREKSSVPSKLRQAPQNQQEREQRQKELEKLKELKEVSIDVQAVLTVIGRSKDPEPDRAERIDLDFINFKGANLESVNLQEASLSFANLQGANLSFANLQGAYLSEANLQEASLWSANLQGANLSFANLQEVYSHFINLQEADLRGANLQEASLWSANLQRVNLSLANLQKANLEGANLQGAFLSLANLQGANLESANLQGAGLRGANLQGANLLKADLQRANLSKAENLTDEQIKSACFWDKAIYEGEWISNMETETWVANDERAEQDNINYIEELKKDKSSDPKEKPDCSRWEKD